MENEPNAASVAIVDDGRVLLIRRARPPYSGLWTLPGGRRERGETTEQCAIREVREELALEVSALRPVTLVTVDAVPPYVIEVFATEAFDASPVPGSEIDGFTWARPEDVATLQTTPGLPSVIEIAIRVLSQP